MRNDFQEEVYQENLGELNQAIRDAESDKEEAMEKLSNEWDAKRDKALDDLADEWEAKLEGLKYERDDFVAREENGGYEG